MKKRIDKQKSLNEITDAEYNNALYRFHQSYAIQENGCWLWTGNKFSYKIPPKPCQLNFIYGQFAFCDLGKRSMRAHRAAWILHNGDIPSKLLVLHTCDMPLCVNPAHLRLGTHQDNMNDMKHRGRAATGERNSTNRYPETRHIGERHGMAKYTNDTIRYVKQLLQRNTRQCIISKLTGVSQCTISHIAKGRQWQNVN